MDARLDTTSLLSSLTGNDRHCEECLDWWKLNYKERFPMIQRWLEETENVVPRYPAPGHPSLSYAMVQNHTGTYKADPFSRVWDRPAEGEAWYFTDEENEFFDREFSPEQLRGYRVNFLALVTAISQALNMKTLVDDSTPLFCRLGLLEGRPTYVAFGNHKFMYNSIFELLTQTGSSTIIFTIGSNVIIDLLKKRHNMDIRDISKHVRVEMDGSITRTNYTEQETTGTKKSQLCKYLVTDKKGKQYLVSEDCGSYSELKDGKPDTKKSLVVLRPLAKAYLRVLIGNVGKTLRREELEKLALDELRRIDENEVMLSDTRISAAFRTTTDNGKKTTHSIYNAIIRGIAWRGGSYMLPEECVTKR